MKVKIKRVDKTLPLPQYHTSGSVGLDLYARVDTKILSKKVGMVPCNVIIATPPGYMLMIASRGSTPIKKGLIPANGVGIGDQDFAGESDEYHFIAYNFTNKAVVVKKGERVAQGIFVKIEKVDWEEVNSMGENPNRGGFGSTGGNK
ncbi:dUTP diphosphatase [Candidatus Daviesbacteria bacterium]|nr:dUTP diphosphatase [Candidatus Daviesbacteria bacterium]